MKTITFLLIFVFASVFAAAQKGFGSEEEATDYYFAFKIMPSFTGELVQCAIIKKASNGEREKVQIIPTDQWVNEFTGYTKSLANPKGENLALKNDIYQIPAEIKALGDAEVKKYVQARTLSILGNLWRLKYSTYPYHTDSDWGDGWAKNADEKITYMPSQKQMDILSDYGIQGFSDFVKGEQAIRLMKDMLNKQWQQTYRESTDPEKKDAGTITDEGKP